MSTKPIYILVGHPYKNPTEVLRIPSIDPKPDHSDTFEQDDLHEIVHVEHYNQGELAMAVGCSPSHLSRVLSGQRKLTEGLAKKIWSELTGS